MSNQNFQPQISTNKVLEKACKPLQSPPVAWICWLRVVCCLGHSVDWIFSTSRGDSNSRSDMVLERGEGIRSPEPSSPEEMITTGSSQAAHSSHAWAPITHTRKRKKKHILTQLMVVDVCQFLHWVCCFWTEKSIIECCRNKDLPKSDCRLLIISA